MAASNAPTYPDFEPGTVWLAGAGPGDPLLITLITRHALETADVVIYDALVSPEVLSFAPDTATLEYAGKRGGRASTKQADIIDGMIQHAKAGSRVLRLKGGDPFVFGRGADECLALVEAGIRFRIIPGITAGIAGLAYAGIPATSRDSNSVICFLTGHAATSEVPEDIEWAALSKVAPVLVFYMPSAHMREICDRLMEAGRPADDAAVVISKATTPDQTVLETTLGSCADDYEASGLVPPVLLVVGPVLEHRAALDWFGK